MQLVHSTRLERVLSQVPGNWAGIYERMVSALVDDDKHAEPMRCWVLHVSLGSGKWWDPLLSLSKLCICEYIKGLHILCGR